MADSDDQPVSKRLRRSHTATTSVPEPATSSHMPKSTKSNTESQPSNSLLRLNDKCLQALFIHLDIKSLCQMADVCKRFRTTAEQVFSQQHKEFVLKGNGCKMSTVRHILCKFGHLITSFDASAAYFHNRNEQINVNAIVKYCSNNLDELLVRSATIDCKAVRPLFGRLKKLSLIMCDFTNGSPATLFSNLPKLEMLDFNTKGSCQFLARTFPKLEELRFDVAYPGYFTFIDMLALNPQIKWLIMFGLPEDIFISAIAECTKNLERLMIRPRFMSSTPEISTKKVFLQLSKLKKLKKLAMNAGDEIYGKLIGPLMDAFAKEKIALDQLELNDFQIGSKDIRSILKIKTIIVLSLNEIEQVTEADLVALATEMPALTTLHLNLGPKAKKPMTVNGLIKIVKDRKKLGYMSLIDVQNLKIDQTSYEKLLEVAQVHHRGTNKEKFLIDIVGHQRTTSFNVPNAVQKSGHAFLEVRYETSDGN